MNASALYTGSISHARLAPSRHAFSYPIYLLYLDLDELPALPLWPALGVERAGLLAFRRRDYLGAASRPLADEVRDRVAVELGVRPDGPVRLLAHVRSFGYVFNPVAFYYCFDRAGRLAAVVSEITNTPWKERHSYVVAAGPDGAASSFDKAFHVSPFFPMTQRYVWRFSAPGDALTVDMQSLEGEREVFRARLALERQPLTRAALLGAATTLPAQAALRHLSIYSQALRLWLRRVPVFTHPKKQLPDAATPTR